MMVIFLVVLVSMILLRTLRKDYARYNREDSLEDLVSFHNPSKIALYFGGMKCLDFLNKNQLYRTRTVLSLLTFDSNGSEVLQSYVLCSF